MRLTAEKAAERVDAVRALVESQRLDGLLLSAPPDVRWLTGFTGSNALVLVRFDAVHLVTDGRYTTQAADEAPHVVLHVPGPDLLAHVTGHLLPGGVERIGFQGDRMSHADATRLLHGPEAVVWVPLTGALTGLRAVKDDDERDAIRRALRVSEAALGDVVAQVRPGVTELDLAAELVYAQLRRGATSMSFDPIVAAGPNAALPHGRPTARPLGAGELLLVDFGCVVDGYASDITRMVACGEPPPGALRVFDAVHDALRAAREAARAGLRARALDAVARDLLAAAGLGDRFTHSLGHGVGLEIHEAPRLGMESDVLLEAGMVVTLEPGVYLPGRLGVRIEDMVRLTADGNERLNDLPTDLIRT